MSLTRAFGAFMCFLFTLFTYAPVKDELVTIAGNATLSNNAIIMFNLVFGLFWAVLAVLFLGMAGYWAMKS